MQSYHTNISNPFLYTVCTRFVIRTVMVNIVMNLFVAQIIEGNIGGDRKSYLLVCRGQTDSRNDLMSSIR